MYYKELFILDFFKSYRFNNFDVLSFTGVKSSDYNKGLYSCNEYYSHCYITIKSRIKNKKLIKELILDTFNLQYKKNITKIMDEITNDYNKLLALYSSSRNTQSIKSFFKTFSMDIDKKTIKENYNILLKNVDINLNVEISKANMLDVEKKFLLFEIIAILSFSTMITLLLIYFRTFTTVRSLKR